MFFFLTRITRDTFLTCKLSETRLCNEIFTFLPEFGCHQEVTASPLQGVVTGHKKVRIKRKKVIHIPQTLWHALVHRERCGQQRVRPFGHHRLWSRPGPPTGLHCFQWSSTGGPDPHSYRVASVSLATLYQSYYPINHTILSVILLYTFLSRHATLVSS